MSEAFKQAEEVEEDITKEVEEDVQTEASLVLIDSNKLNIKSFQKVIDDNKLNGMIGYDSNTDIVVNSSTTKDFTKIKNLAKKYGVVNFRIESVQTEAEESFFTKLNQTRESVMSEDKTSRSDLASIAILLTDIRDKKITPQQAMLKLNKYLESVQTEAIKAGDKVHCPSGFCKVVSIKGKKVIVRTKDGDAEYDLKQVQKESVQTEEFKPGDKVVVAKTGNVTLDSYGKGKVIKQVRGTVSNPVWYQVKFDNGETHDVSSSNLKKA